MTLSQILRQSVECHEASRGGTATIKRALNKAIGAMNEHQHSMAGRLSADAWTSPDYLRPFDTFAAMQRQVFGAAELAREFETMSRPRSEVEGIESWCRGVADMNVVGRFEVSSYVTDAFTEVAEASRQLLTRHWETSNTVEAYASTLRNAAQGLGGVLEFGRAPWSATRSTICRAPVPSLVDTLSTVRWTGLAAPRWPTTAWHEAVRHFTDFVPPELADFSQLFRYLALKSWYISLDALENTGLRARDLYRRNAAAELTNRLCEYYRMHLDEIKNEVVVNYPDHERRVLLAFAAHCRGEYELSIPAFVIAADAIAHKIWQESFFQFKYHKSAVLARLGSAPSRLNQPHLLPLLIPGGMRKRTDYMAPVDPPFNRHAEIHGILAHQDTETASLQCIALLDYLHSLAPEFAPASATVARISQ